MKVMQNLSLCAIVDTTVMPMLVMYRAAVRPDGSSATRRGTQVCTSLAVGADVLRDL